MQVIKNGPAEKAGIKEKDIITKIDDVELNKMGQLRRYIYTKNPEEEVTLTVQRNGIKVPLKVTLGKK